jgi:cephalosporin-C deacetylase
VLEPADFDDFWATTLDEHPWRADGMTLVDVETGLRDVRVQDLTFPGFDRASPHG